MSTTPSPHPHVAVSPPVPPADREIRIYSHSSLYYWWPVWAAALLMAILTLIKNDRMITVPTGIQTSQLADGRGVIIFPEGHQPPDTSKLLFMHPSKGLGVIFSVILLLIIVISNVPLRGLWSVIIVMFIVLLVVILVLGGWWSEVVEKVRLLDIRINMGGYLFIGLVLLLIWAITIFIFDHRTYVAVTPGQVRVCLAVGAGETAYDTTGMTFQKRQDDLFRHWIIGLGSGDLIIHRTNTNQEIDLPNVLFIGSKIRQIEQLMKEREVV